MLTLTATIAACVVSVITTAWVAWALTIARHWNHRLEMPAFAYAKTFEQGRVSSTPNKIQTPEVATRQLSTPAKIPAGHRQFLPAKTSKELQDEFKKREEEAPIPRASRWTRASPSKRYAAFYVGTLAIAIFTLLLITGRLPLR
jgi:hypothetical protein